MKRLVLLVLVISATFSAFCQGRYGSYSIDKDGTAVHHIPDKPVSLARIKITDNKVNEYLMETLLPLIARADSSINVKDEIYITFRYDSITETEKIIFSIFPLRDAPLFVYLTQGTEMEYENFGVIDNPYMPVYSITFEDINFINPTREETGPMQWNVRMKRFEFNDACSLQIRFKYNGDKIILTEIRRERGYDHIPDSAIESTLTRDETGNTYVY